MALSLAEANWEKDAYDILSLVRSCVDGPEHVVSAFCEEKRKDNTGLALAMKTLEQNFTHPESPGPMLAASFYLGPGANMKSTIRLREDLVTVALALLNS
jgi:hypothetical protein